MTGKVLVVVPPTPEALDLELMRGAALSGRMLDRDTDIEFRKSSTPCTGPADQSALAIFSPSMVDIVATSEACEAWLPDACLTIDLGGPAQHPSLAQRCWHLSLRAEDTLFELAADESDLVAIVPHEGRFDTPLKTKLQGAKIHRYKRGEPSSQRQLLQTLERTPPETEAALILADRATTQLLVAALSANAYAPRRIYVASLGADPMRFLPEVGAETDAEILTVSVFSAAEEPRIETRDDELLPPPPPQHPSPRAEGSAKLHAQDLLPFSTRKMSEAYARVFAQAPTELALVAGIASACALSRISTHTCAPLLRRRTWVWDLESGPRPR